MALTLQVRSHLPLIVLHFVSVAMASSNCQLNPKLPRLPVLALYHVFTLHQFGHSRY